MTGGTVFADTRLPLTTWFQAAWYVTGTKHGVSALGLQRLLGLGSYETAWALLHKLRRAMVRPGRDKLDGEVEVDETAIGLPRRAALDAAPLPAGRSWRSRSRRVRAAPVAASGWLAFAIALASSSPTS